MGPDMETKRIHTEVKALPEKGVFEAIFSVFGNVDEGGDRVLAGAFDETLKTNPTPPVVWSHQWGTPPIGVSLEVEAMPKGARGKGRLFMDEHPLAAPIYAGMRDGAIKEFSFGYSAKDVRRVEEDGKDVREIAQLELYEWGPTVVGMNRETELLGLKHVAVGDVATTLLASYVRDAIAAKVAAAGAELGGQVFVCPGCGAHAEKATPAPGPHTGPDAKPCTYAKAWSGFTLTPIAPDDGHASTHRDANSDQAQKRLDLVTGLFR